MIRIKLEHIIYEKEPMIVTRSCKRHFLLILHRVACVNYLFETLEVNVLQILYFSKMIVVIFEIRQLQFISIANKIKRTLSRNRYPQQFPRKVNLIFIGVICLPFFNY